MKKKELIVISFIGIIIIVLTATVIKIVDTNLESEYNNVIDSFIYYSKKCLKEEKCTNNIITLKELYDNNYLSRQINPKTKQYFNEKSYIKILNYDFVLIK